MTERGATRRELVLGAARLGVAGSLLATASASAASSNDAGILYEVLTTEQLAVYVYEQALASPALPVSAEPLARRVFAHEQAHVQALTARLASYGAGAPSLPATTADANALLSARHIAGSIASLSNEHDLLTLLVRLEQRLAGDYYNAMSKWSDLRLLELGAQLLASEAQHATILSELLYPGDIDKAVPWSFVEGTQ